MVSILNLILLQRAGELLGEGTGGKTLSLASRVTSRVTLFMGGKPAKV